jgi:hypothetical protein
MSSSSSYSTPTPISATRSSTNKQQSSSSFNKFLSKRLDHEWWSIKGHALMWIIISAIVFYYTGFGYVILTSPDIATGWMWTGVVLILLGLICLFYMAYHLPKTNNNNSNSSTISVQNIENDMARYPVILPVSVSCLLFGFFCLCCAFWPIYKGFTPLILSLFWWSGFMCLHFIPYI